MKYENEIKKFLEKIINTSSSKTKYISPKYSKVA